MIRWFICSALLGSWSSGELYSAVSDLDRLLKTEAKIIETFTSYFQKIEEKVVLLKRVVAEYKEDHLKNVRNPTEEWINPISAYHIIKRVAVEWRQLESFISFQNDTEDTITILDKIRKNMAYPGHEDLLGAASGIIRTQDMYNINTTSFAKGEINGQQYSTQLSAQDCYELGLHSYNNRDHHHTKLWMYEALRLAKAEGNKSLVAQWDILEYLSYSIYMQDGDLHEALRLTEELLKLYPDHPRALQSKEYYVEAIKNGTALESKRAEKEVSPPDEDSENYLHKMTCRNAVSPPASLLAKLHCYYNHHNHPFLILAPLKVEEAYLNPSILLFREILLDSEVETIKNIATARLERARVENGSEHTGVVSEVRVSKVSWLEIKDSPTVRNLYQRVEDMTYLSTETAELLQVLNYGIGGHYDIHEDFARDVNKSTITKSGTGNRIATVLFYLSDVAEGGATVFPNLQVGVWPEKGTALYWMNLHPDGRGDDNSRHAGCPVLVGSKWVATVWMHEKGQRCKSSNR